MPKKTSDLAHHPGLRFEGIFRYRRFWRKITLRVSPGEVLDVDADESFGALTDGVLILRYLFGLTGTALTDGALGAAAIRTDPTVIQNYLDGVRASLDIDGNDQTDALTDGLLILRYLLGLRGDALIAGVVDPLGKRKTATDIETYIQSLMQ